MSASGFTPAPWSYVGTGHMVGGPDRVRVADCFCLERPSEERMANAHLISAAPDLYALLERLAKDNTLVSSVNWWTQVDVALAKARGEGGAA